MLIAFWSIAHGQTANTVNTAVISSMLALENNLKTLICHSHFSRSILEKCFVSTRLLEQDRMGAFSDRGIDALSRLAKNGKLTKNSIPDYTISLLKDNRLDLLVGTETEDHRIFQNILDVLNQIFDCSSEFYDVVAVDVHSGLNNQITNAIVERADIIIINLNQNVYLLNDFFSNKDIAKYLKDKKHIINISKYDSQSKYTLKNISRKYNIKDIIAVPYQAQLLDACNDSNILDYLVRQIFNVKSDEHSNFINQLRENCKTILNVSGVKEG
ncbi:MAG: hypothetical protein ACLFMO_04815 [Eubacteriales bacterium]